MKVETETQTIASSIALTKEEIETLVSAQKILNNLWSKLEDVDTMDITVTSIYNKIDGIGFDLDDIANLVDVEN